MGFNSDFVWHAAATTNKFSPSHVKWKASTGHRPTSHIPAPTCPLAVSPLIDCLPWRSTDDKRAKKPGLPSWSQIKHELRRVATDDKRSDKRLISPSCSCRLRANIYPVIHKWRDAICASSCCPSITHAAHRHTRCKSNNIIFDNFSLSPSTYTRSHPEQTHTLHVFYDSTWIFVPTWSPHHTRLSLRLLISFLYALGCKFFVWALWHIVKQFSSLLLAWQSFLRDLWVFSWLKNSLTWGKYGVDFWEENKLMNKIKSSLVYVCYASMYEYI